MPDFDQMREHLERAQHEVDLAIAAMAPMDKMTQLESYVLGYLRSSQSVLAKANEAIEQTRALRKKKAQNTEREPEKKS